MDEFIWKGDKILINNTPKKYIEHINFQNYPKVRKTGMPRFPDFRLLSPTNQDQIAFADG
jgi:hypothetical protein